ncbi:uncharacterized protein LOC143920178 [Arctopsyche grandis]|uniref:uncharacterized protein LOC143920178 n=1 Tax=Arctopsyche grandis TaxID=121162 RepID=UPI00406D88E4
MTSSRLTSDGRSFEDRLLYFVSSFVIHIETKLNIHYKILEENIKKLGKTGEVITSALEIPVKYLTGSKGVARVLIKPIKILFEERNKKKSYLYVDLAYSFQDNNMDGRKIFVDIGIDVFKSFEHQLMIVDTKNGPRCAMEKLGKEAANRYLNFVKNGKAQESSSKEMRMNKLKARNVVYGKSKICFNKVCNISGNSKLYIISKADNSKQYWSTEDVFEKCGIITKENEFYTSNVSECDRYYYRRLFDGENFSVEYKPVNKPELKFNYKDDSFYSEQDKNILKKINNDDENFKRVLLSTFNEFKDDIENKYRQNNNEINENHNEIKNLLKSLQDSIEEDRIEFYEIMNKHIKNKCELKPFEKVNPPVKKRIEFGSDLLKHRQLFIGRKDELDKLHKILIKHQDPPIISQRVTITGLGGIGKTSLAMKYAYDKLSTCFYHNIVFIESYDTENIVKSFKKLANDMKVPTETTKQDRNINEIIENIYEHLNDETRSLIIFDNVEKYENVKDFIFEGSSLNESYIYTIITSRQKCQDTCNNGILEMIQLKEFSDYDAVNYFTNILTTEKKKCIEKLTKRLGNLPLALKHARSHTPLVKAAENGNQEVVEYFLEKENVEDVSKALECAAANGHSELVDFIYGKYENFLNKDQLIFQSKLRRAIRQKDIEIYDELIQSYPQYKESKFEGAFGENILHFAAKHNDVKIMEIFLNNGIDVNVLDKRKMTPIYYAIENHSKKALKFLLKSNADINNVDKDGETPLHCVINKGNKTLCKIILEKKQKIDTCDKLGRTAIHLAAKNQNEDICKMVLDKKPEINVCDVSGKTPLHYAIEYFYLSKICEMILDEGADINIIDNVGKTPMHYAVEYNHHTALMMMFKKGPKFYIQDESGKTLLHYAVEYSYERICEIILSETQYMNIADNDGNTPMHYSAEFNNESICAMVSEKTPNINVRDNSGKTPLHYTIEYFSSSKICEMIVEKGADISIADNDGKTPMHYAVEYNHETAFIMMFTKEPKFDIQDKFGKTLLHYAVIYNRESICTIILSKAQDINIIDNDGKTPMHYSAEFNNEPICKMLLEKGANVNLKDKLGKAPLNYAIEYCFSVNSVLKMILERSSDDTEILQYTMLSNQTMVVFAKCYWSYIAVERV